MTAFDRGAVGEHLRLIGDLGGVLFQLAERLEEVDGQSISCIARHIQEHSREVTLALGLFPPEPPTAA
jgi:hypothetical protein